MTRQVVCAFLAWSASSSGVEQLFSKMKRSPVELASANADTDRRVCAAMGCTLDQAQEEEMLQEARAIYARLNKSGTSRSSEGRTKRLDFGRQGPLRQSSHKNWMRERKQAVEVAAAAAAQLVTPPRKISSQDLPPSSRKEADQQSRLEKKRKAEAYSDGLLLTSEVTQAVVAEAEKQGKTNAPNDRARRFQFHSRHAAVEASITKKTVAWALKGLPSPALNVDAATDWTARLRQCGVSLTEEPWFYLVCKFRYNSFEIQENCLLFGFRH